MRVRVSTKRKRQRRPHRAGPDGPSVKATAESAAGAQPNDEVTDMNAHEAYPLSWPVGWPRARAPSRSKFGNWTLYSARQQLQKELASLGARSVVLSTNIPLRQDGLPYSNVREPADHGVAVYFRIKGEPRVLACDKWNLVSHNMIALARHVEAIRGQIRWGVGSVEQAFGGYRALPAMPPSRTWFEVLGVEEEAAWDRIEAARLALLAKNHPDVGGQTSVAAEINAAFDEARSARATV